MPVTTDSGAGRRRLGEDEAVPESFHDCKVEGIRWKRRAFELVLDLQYILKWIPPREEEASYRFLMVKSRLRFRGVEEARIEMDWSKDLLGPAEIESMVVEEARKLTTGGTQRRFVISFSQPDGEISLWSTGYELELLEEPVLCDLPSLPE